MFFLHHIYTAMLVAVEEESGLMESIFTGWKFFPERLLKRFENEAMSPPALETVPGVVEETEKTATQR
jgi:Ni/Fe-hydrogenase 1 B-type cytochrome subunit